MHDFALNAINGVSKFINTNMTKTQNIPQTWRWCWAPTQMSTCVWRCVAAVEKLKTNQSKHVQMKFLTCQHICSEISSGQTCSSTSHCTVQGQLQFAVTGDEDSANDCPAEMKLCGELCEISDDIERPGLWTAKKSSSGINPPDLKSRPLLG